MSVHRVCPTCTCLEYDPDDNMVPSTHRDGPNTEKINAWRETPKTGSKRRMVLIALCRVGQLGLTDDELELEVGFRSAKARRNELTGGGWVRNSGLSRKTRWGTGIVWVPTDKAIKWWGE